jgi:hypothetical protein
MGPVFRFSCDSLMVKVNQAITIKTKQDQTSKGIPKTFIFWYSKKLNPQLGSLPNKAMCVNCQMQTRAIIFIIWL